MLGQVYAWTGEHDLALTELEKAARLPQGPSYGELRFNPAWMILGRMRGSNRC